MATRRIEFVAASSSERQPTPKRARLTRSKCGALTVIGAGLRAMSHLTREADVALDAADIVFAGLDGTGPDRRWMEVRLAAKSVDVIDLNQFYPTDHRASRTECYVKSAEAIMAAVRSGKNVAYVVYGHPCVVDATTELLLRTAGREAEASCRIRIRVLPGISSVDALMASLGLDPSSGMLVATATDLASSAHRGVGIANAIGRGKLPHLVLLGVCAVGDPGTGAAVAAGLHSLVDSPAWLALVSVLQKAYGAQARCIMYRAPVWASILHACLLSVPLDVLKTRDFVDRLVECWGGELGTLYISGEANGEDTSSSSPSCGSSTSTSTGTGTGTVSGFDAEHSAWLRRHRVYDLKDERSSSSSSSK